jgi:hypothetical protein
MTDIYKLGSNFMPLDVTGRPKILAAPATLACHRTFMFVLGTYEICPRSVAPPVTVFQV